VLVQDCTVNASLSAVLCFSPSLNNALDAAFSTDGHPVSVPIHFEMSSDDDVAGRTLQFRADQQHLANFTYVSDPVFFPFPGEHRLRKFFTDESHLVLQVNDCIRLCCYCPRSSDGLYCFPPRFFICDHDNS